MIRPDYQAVDSHILPKIRNWQWFVERIRRLHAARQFHHPGREKQKWEGAHVARHADHGAHHCQRATAGYARSAFWPAFARLHQVPEGKRKLDQRAGVSNWVVHDIRRSVATKLADLGIAPHVVEEVLGHSGHKRGVAAVYNKSVYATEVRNALLIWDDHVRTLVEGSERKVLPLVAP
jgi:hypothetical protein